MKCDDNKHPRFGNYCAMIQRWNKMKGNCTSETQTSKDCENCTRINSGTQLARK